MSLSLHTVEGEALRFAVDRWYAEPAAEEEELLQALAGPVLDVGCGPGRHVLALNRRGIVALGIDAAPAAVAVARARGASVIERSVFDRVPGAGRWRSALLLDGNVGIGGDPVALLQCVRRLLAPTGIVAVELEPPGIGVQHLRARLQDGQQSSAWFEWARVGIDGLASVTDRSGLDVLRTWERGCRWFAFLTPRSL